MNMSKARTALNPETEAWNKDSTPTVAFMRDLCPSWQKAWRQAIHEELMQEDVDRIERRAVQLFAGDEMAALSIKLTQAEEAYFDMRSVLATLVASLEWEAERSGITYAGFEEARELLKHKP